MADRGTGATARYLRILFNQGVMGSHSDGQLLDRFCSNRDDSESAFAALVERHGPMVLRLCRQVIGDEHEAQDAAQAVFLVLARRAGSIRHRDSIASWLYRVARRIAARARVGAARRRDLERRSVEMAARQRAGERDDPDLGVELYEELDRLSERYRAPIILCHLEGLSHEQAAERLGCPLRTLQTRLLRGRESLRQRLVRRGVVPTAVLGTASLAVPTALPAAWLDGTVRASMAFAAGGAALTGTVPITSATLARGALTAMFLQKLSFGAVTGLVLCGLTAGGGALAFQRSIIAPDGASVAGPSQTPDSSRPVIQARANAKIDHGTLKALQGEWLLTKFEPTEGRDWLRAVQLTWMFDGDKLTIRSSDGKTMEYDKVVIDERTAPVSIDLIRDREDGTRTVERGLIHLGEGQFDLCINGLDDPRPTRFEPEYMQPFPVVYSFRRAQPAAKVGSEVLRAIQGRWELTNVVPPRVMGPVFHKNAEFWIDGTTLRTMGTAGIGRVFELAEGFELARSEITIDDGVDPVRIDVAVTLADGVRAVQRGLLRLEPEGFQVCLNGPDSPRPPDFEPSFPRGSYIVENSAFDYLMFRPTEFTPPKGGPFPALYTFRRPQASLELSRGDGEAKGRRSIAGGGHAVRFEAPAEGWLLTSVRLHGGAHGTPEPPLEGFIVFVCDDEFKKVAEFAFPYSTFERGDPKWVTLDVKPTSVPKSFLLGFAFNPSQTKGVYVSFDAEGSGQSFVGLPGGRPQPFKDGDWLIRRASPLRPPT